MSWNAWNVCKDQPCLYYSFFNITLIHVGEDPVDKQHKVRETNTKDKNNYAEDQELIHNFGECFYYINLYTV